MTKTPLSRRQMIDLVLAFPAAELQSEIAHQMSVEREYDYDEIAALFDVEDRADLWLREGDRTKAALLRDARQLMIEIGFYRPMSDEEVSSTFTSSGRSPWVFKFKGVPYTSDDTSEQWMFPDALEDGQEPHT